MTVGDYLKRWPAPKSFVKEGDEIDGILVAWDAMSEKYPVLHLQTAGGLIRIVRVTNARLHELLVDLDPDIGDRLFIRFDGLEAKAAPGMNKAKKFTVERRARARSNGTTDPSTQRTPDPGPKQTLTGSASRGNPP